MQNKQTNVKTKRLTIVRQIRIAICFEGAFNEKINPVRSFVSSLAGHPSSQPTTTM